MLAHEAPLRLGFFFGILLFMALWEVISRRRALTTAKGTHWFANLGLVAITDLIFPGGTAFSGPIGRNPPRDTEA